MSIHDLRRPLPRLHLLLLAVPSALWLTACSDDAVIPAPAPPEDPLTYRTTRHLVGLDEDVTIRGDGDRDDVIVVIDRAGRARYRACLGRCPRPG